MLVVLGAICERESRLRTAIALAIASIAIPAAVWWWQPQFDTYRGLSGLDCALFGLFATLLLRRDRVAPKIVGAVALFGVVAKCAFEIATGSSAFADGVGYSPVPLAHLIGV